MDVSLVMTSAIKKKIKLYSMTPQHSEVGIKVEVGLYNAIYL